MNVFTSGGLRGRHSFVFDADVIRPGGLVKACLVDGKKKPACHGSLAQGAVKAGITISIIEEQRGKQPPDLTDDQSDHGSTDAEIFGVIKRGLPPTMMPGFGGPIPDADIWSIVNYLRTLRQGRPGR